MEDQEWLKEVIKKCTREVLENVVLRMTTELRFFFFRGSPRRKAGHHKRERHPKGSVVDCRSEHADTRGRSDIQHDMNGSC